MKIVTVVQMLFGSLECAASLLLAMNKTRYIEESSTFHSGGHVVDYIPPSAQLEFFLLGCGIIVLLCALFQMKYRIRLSGLQILSGAVIVSSALFFSIRAATIGHFEYSALYYSVYALAVLGAAVVVIGIFQLARRT